MILIIGSKEEVHANFIYEKLISEKEDVSFFDTRLIPNNLTISWNPSDCILEKGSLEYISMLNSCSSTDIFPVILLP